MITLLKNVLVPKDEALYDRLYDLGKEEFGLVDPRVVIESPDSLAIAVTQNKTKSFNSGEYTLVWEENDIGYWNFSCQITVDPKGYQSFPLNKETEYSSLEFQYWLRRSNRDILERDPMRPFLEKVLEEIILPIPVLESTHTIEEILEMKEESFRGKIITPEQVLRAVKESKKCNY